jgi:hypothetical protein
MDRGALKGALSAAPAAVAQEQEQQAFQAALENAKEERRCYEERTGNAKGTQKKRLPGGKTKEERNTG